MEETKIGEVVKFFDGINVAIIRLNSNIGIGDNLHYRGGSTDFEEVITSIEIEGNPIENASMGDTVGIHVTNIANPGDIVFKVSE